MSLRNLGLLAAAVLVTAGTVGIAAAPALAADADLSIGLTGATIAHDSVGKHLTITVVNRGTTKPASASLVVDASAADTTKVQVTDALAGCTGDNNVRTCPIDATTIPGPGGSAHYSVPVALIPKAVQGSAGKITVSIKAAGDATTANDTATADLKVGYEGADLQVYTADVTALSPSGAISADPVTPGKVTTLRVAVSNEGEGTAQGIDVAITLPEHTSFVADDKDLYTGCVIGADRRTIDCAMKQYQIRPSSTPDGKLPTTVFKLDFRFAVLVAPDATGPLLRGGVVSAQSISPAVADVDSSDNSDPFVIFVAGSGSTASPSASATTSGSPSPSTSVSASVSPSTSTSPAAGGQAGGDDDGGGLPITGPSGLATGGTGLALIAVGVALLVATRRRRSELEH